MPEIFGKKPESGPAKVENGGNTGKLEGQSFTQKSSETFRNDANMREAGAHHGQHEAKVPPLDSRLKNS